MVLSTASDPSLSELTTGKNCIQYTHSCETKRTETGNHQSWGLAWHRNEGIELTFMARGKLDYSVDDQIFVLESDN